MEGAGATEGWGSAEGVDAVNGLGARAHTGASEASAAHEQQHLQQDGVVTGSPPRAPPLPHQLYQQQEEGVRSVLLDNSHAAAVSRSSPAASPAKRTTFMPATLETQPAHTDSTTAATPPTSSSQQPAPEEPVPGGVAAGGAGEDIAHLQAQLQRLSAGHGEALEAKEQLQLYVVQLESERDALQAELAAARREAEGQVQAAGEQASGQLAAAQEAVSRAEAQAVALQEELEQVTCLAGVKGVPG